MKSYQNAGQEPFLYYYRDSDAKEDRPTAGAGWKALPLGNQEDGYPTEKLTKVFELIDKSPLQRGTGAVLCMAEKLGAFDENNLIVPIGLI